MNKLVSFLSFWTISFFAFSQTITGNLSQLPGQKIQLEGFNGLKTYPIASTIIDESGDFNLTYSLSDYGVGYLKSTDNQPLFVILSGEDIVIQGDALSYVETLRITKGKENQWFEAYAKAQPKREQALSAWVYLENIYTQDEEFEQHKQAIKAIQKEKTYLKDKSNQFIASLPKNSYVKWFLPTRKLVSSVSTVAQYRPDEIPETIAAFRDLDYTDKRLYKSGLFKDAIESHFWLLENSGKPLEEVFDEMKLSIDAMMEDLVFDEKKLNEITNYLFDLLERHSLFQASEYLALKVLNEVSCTLDNDLENQLETYRKMKKGNIAPDIVLKATANQPTKLSEIKSDYTLVVFAASWCPKCTTEVPEIAKLYKQTWKNQKVEVVLVSLDENKEDYTAFTKDLPFLSTCDFLKWNSPIAKDYHVFGTPTMYLLDKQRKIILRPNSVKQVDAWVDWYLVKGNKMRE